MTPQEIADEILLYMEEHRFIYAMVIKDDEIRDRIAQIIEKHMGQQTTVFTCGDRKCGHKWDGPIWKSEDGRSESTTCSKCGAISLHHDLWVMP